MKPLAIDLFCGLGGWTEGLLSEGYRVVGFDNVRHAYGDAKYPAQLVIQDVLTLHGSQFKDAALIVASPPCQAYSYRAMPWKKAKALPPPDNALFEACFRIQREASDAAGQHIPLVVENVCGAQKWVGRARWHYGSFYLWGDVPALMPITRRAKFKGGDRNIGRTTGTHKWNTGFDVNLKVGGFSWSDYGKPGYKAQAFNGTADKRLRDDIKNTGGSWFNVAHNTTSGVGQNPTKRNDPRDGVKVASDEGRRTDVGKGSRFTSRDCGIERVSFGSGVPGCGDTEGLPHIAAGSDQQHARSIKTGGDGIKGVGCGSASWQSREQRHPNDPRNFYSKSSARKAASAHIAKISIRPRVPHRAGMETLVNISRRPLDDCDS